MSTKRPRVRASESAPGLDRRQFLIGAAGGALALALRSTAARADGPAELPGATRDALAQSPFVYVSPLRSDGKESRCHGEVWYGWFDGAVHLTTSRTTWKARALARGLDRARIWVGDYGRAKSWLGTDETFRKAPHFAARVRQLDDAAAVEQLLGIFARKYPDEFPSWKPRMEAGHRSGERLLLRYEPVSG